MAGMDGNRSLQRPLQTHHDRQMLAAPPPPGNAPDPQPSLVPDVSTAVVPCDGLKEIGDGTLCDDCSLVEVHLRPAILGCGPCVTTSGWPTCDACTSWEVCSFCRAARAPRRDTQTLKPLQQTRWPMVHDFFRGGVPPGWFPISGQIASKRSDLTRSWQKQPPDFVHLFTILQYFAVLLAPVGQNSGDSGWSVSGWFEGIYRFEKRSELVQQNRFGRSRKLVGQPSLWFIELSQTVDRT